MKLIPIFIAVALLAWGCTETVYVEVPGKTDTLKVEQFIDRYFQGTDTVTITQVIEVPVPTRTQDTVIMNVNDTIYIDRVDTLYQERIVYVDRIDSVFIERIVYLTDTIAITQVVHVDTLYIYPARGVYSVPRELQPIVDAFYQDAFDRGFNAYGGHISITVEPIDDVLQAYSYRTYGQVNLVINSNHTTDESLLPIYRELARWQLKKEYSQDPSHPMFPFFASNVVRYSNRAQHKLVIDKIFQ